MLNQVQHDFLIYFIFGDTNKNDIKKAA